MVKRFVLWFIIVFLFFPFAVNAVENEVVIYFFHSNTCSHCIEEERVLKEIKKKYSNVKIYRYEIHDDENNQLLDQVRNLYQITSRGVPVTVIGDTIYIGFGDKAVSKFIYTIEYYSKYSYHDKVGELILDGYVHDDEDIDYSIDLNQYIKSNEIKAFGVSLNSIDVSTSSLLLAVSFLFSWQVLIQLLILLFFFYLFRKSLKKQVLFFIFFVFGSLLLFWLEGKFELFHLYQSYFLFSNFDKIISYFNFYGTILCFYFILLLIGLFNFQKKSKER